MRVLGQLDVSGLHSNSELDRVGYQDELIIELVLLCSVIYPPTYGLSRVEPLTNNRLSYLSRMLPTALSGCYLLNCCVAHSHAQQCNVRQGCGYPIIPPNHSFPIMTKLGHFRPSKHARFASNSMFISIHQSNARTIKNEDASQLKCQTPQTTARWIETTKAHSRQRLTLVPALCACQHHAPTANHCAS
jgi:hypothetical protein